MHANRTGDGFGRCRGAVVDGEVGHGETDQFADEALEFPHGLEHALAHFSLVRRVGGQELATRDQLEDRCWHVVSVEPRPMKEAMLPRGTFAPSNRRASAMISSSVWEGVAANPPACARQRERRKTSRPWTCSPSHSASRLRVQGWGVGRPSCHLSRDQYRPDLIIVIRTQHGESSWPRPHVACHGQGGDARHQRLRPDPRVLRQARWLWRPATRSRCTPSIARNTPARNGGRRQRGAASPRRAPYGASFATLRGLRAFRQARSGLRGRHRPRGVPRRRHPAARTEAAKEGHCDRV